MAGIATVHARFDARTTTVAAIVAVMFLAGGGQHASGQNAPIVYARGAMQTASLSPADLRFSNRVDSLPASSAAASHSYDEAAPIDLTRPGMPVKVNPAKISYGPALPSASRLDQPARPLSAPAQTAALAEPYAGPPYQVEGKWYVPTYEPNYDEVGIASWYGPTFHGKASASGEVFDENAMTAAHPTLPIPSLVRVTNLENGKQVIVRLNDRGPFVDDRIIDLSKKAGQALDLHGQGTAKVRVQYVGPAPATLNSLPAVQPSQPMQAYALVTPRIQHLPPSEVSHIPQQLERAAAPAPAQLAQAVAQRGYFLQAGSFADLGNAQTLRQKLQLFGPVTVTAVQVGGTEFYRVMVGPWTSRLEAERVQRDLAEAGMKPIVVAKLD